MSSTPTMTIKDLAKLCGVSRQAVSYALRGDGRLADETRQRIQAVAQQVGYRPNSIARTMRTGRFGAIALVTGTEPTYHRFPHGLWESVHDALAASDLHLMMARIPEGQLSTPDYLPKVFREWSVDGVMVNYTHNIPTVFADTIAAHRIPAVWLNTRRAKNCVAPADFDAGRMATEHLLERGHRRIGYLNLSREGGHYSEIDRRAGYEAALRTAGQAPQWIDSPQPPAVPADRVGHRLAAARGVLTGPDRPTAIVTYSSFTGEPLLVAAMSLGLRVPEDLAIVTIEDYPVESVGLPMTTVVLDVREMGRRAVAMVLGQVQNTGAAEETVLVPPTFVQGATT